MLHFFSENKIKGHLEIYKRFNDGTEIKVHDDHNTIVSGMSVGLSYLFGGVGSQRISDYHLDRFQVGVSGAQALEVSSTYQLSSPLATAGAYGTNRTLNVVSGTQIVNGVLTANRVFALIPESHATRVTSDSVRYTIVLDENTVTNGVDLNEIGLFMRNPSGGASTASILVAYKYFSPITKTSDFSLIFRWTINF